MIPATVESIRQATPTVRVIRLRPAGEFGFKAGQWMDLYADLPGGRSVAGYTMTSSPAESVVELAVRHSDQNPVTAYLHRGAAPGDSVTIDGGHGDVYYETGMADRLFLVAGGIGVTPAVSILRYVADSCPGVEATLLYSARIEAELLYRPEIDALAAETGRIRPIYTLTREKPAGWGGLLGRLDEEKLRSVGVDPEALHYVCGPREMIQDTVTLLGRLGVRRSRIKSEVWW